MQNGNPPNTLRMIVVPVLQQRRVLVVADEQWVMTFIPSESRTFRLDVFQHRPDLLSIRIPHVARCENTLLVYEGLNEVSAGTPGKFVWTRQGIHYVFDVMNASKIGRRQFARLLDFSLDIVESNYSTLQRLAYAGHSISEAMRPSDADSKALRDAETIARKAEKRLGRRKRGTNG